MSQFFHRFTNKLTQIAYTSFCMHRNISEIRIELQLSFRFVSEWIRFLTLWYYIELFTRKNVHNLSSPSSLVTRSKPRSSLCFLTCTIIWHVSWLTIHFPLLHFVRQPIFRIWKQEAGIVLAYSWKSVCHLWKFFTSWLLLHSQNSVVLNKNGSYNKKCLRNLTLQSLQNTLRMADRLWTRPSSSLYG